MQQANAILRGHSQTCETSNNLQTDSVCLDSSFQVHNSQPSGTRECLLAYLDSIFFVRDEIDACLHSGISALAQHLFLQSIDICWKELDKLGDYFVLQYE